ncbi:MAG TPA: MotA/TolQ/ExbB proton channel family protein [Candidatus Acidoferrales bacterium]|nr:MotA/TolQ/ExbB proton channel family protein [Candidatus Acidoferrales bacterium]
MGFEDASSGEKNISYAAFVIFAGRLGAIFLQTGWVARVVLLILLFLSLFSWAIILQKYSMFGTLEPRTKRFMQLFRTGRGLPDPNTLRAGSSGSPFVNVYDAGYRELEGQLAGGNPHPGKLKNPRAVLVEMQLASADEVRRMESWMPWLATIGSISTFIGLFGTVWGVMDAFAGLSEVGQASLQAVAPGIADALITTAAGLFTAIPAVIAYNIYLHRIRDFALRMDNFATEFVSKIETLYS